jgi:hypothetical protein
VLKFYRKNTLAIVIKVGDVLDVSKLVCYYCISLPFIDTYEYLLAALDRVHEATKLTQTQLDNNNNNNINNNNKTQLDQSEEPQTPALTNTERSHSSTEPPPPLCKQRFQPD